MANPLMPVVELTIGEQSYKLRFDFEAIAQAEDAAGIALLTGLSPKDVKTPRVNIVRGMLYASMLCEQPDVQYVQVKLMVTRENIAAIWGKVLEAWVNMLSDEKGEAKDPNAPSQS